MPPALVATAPQGMWVRLSISQDWLPGEKRTFYLYSYFALAANTNIRVCWPVASCVHAAQQACRVATRWSQSFFHLCVPRTTQPAVPAAWTIADAVHTVCLLEPRRGLRVGAAGVQGFQHHADCSHVSCPRMASC